MSIMETRLRKANQKRQKRSKRFILSITGLSALFILITCGIALLVIKQYKDTHKWNKDSFTGTYAELPAEFAKNHLSVDIVEDLNKLTVVTNVLNSVKSDNGLTRNTITSAKSALKQSKATLEKHKIVSVDNQDLLQLYIDIYEIEQQAYSSFNVDKLSQVMTKLSKRVVEYNNEWDLNIQSRLNTIATDYNSLNTFVDTYVPQLGDINNGIITVKSNVTSVLTNEMLDTINTNNLDKFKNILELKSILQSSKWRNIMVNNKAIQDKESWTDIVTMFESLTKSEYIKASNITTYKDAINAGFSITGVETRAGYIATTSSPVQSISVNGKAVKNNQYIRKGLAVVARVKAVYEKDPNHQESETSESSTTRKSSTSSSSKTSTETEASTDTLTDLSDTTSSQSSPSISSITTPSISTSETQKIQTNPSSSANQSSTSSRETIYYETDNQ